MDETSQIVNCTDLKLLGGGAGWGLNQFKPQPNSVDSPTWGNTNDPGGGWILCFIRTSPT